MNNTSVKILIVLGLCLLGLFFFKEWKEAERKGPEEIVQPGPTPDKPPPGPSPAPGPPKDLAHTGFKGKEFIYTRHARCRMGCREIDATEVADILLNGKINSRKSNLQDKPCPTYAYEATSRDGQRIRAVVAECSREVKLVTVIDLGKNHKCNCD